MGNITPFLWFDANAEEAADFYLTVFPDGRKLKELRATEAGPGPVGSLIVLELELAGQRMTFLNGGPGHPPTVAFSFYVLCETQEEIDGYWAKLTEGGSEVACGWLRDKFGLSWQIVPAGMTDWLKHPAAMRAMMGMKKLEIAVLKQVAGV
jgi:predicted 3-demethylubiquinone-9 3-methyltransferase (glyoxalase superfamily)